MISLNFTVRHDCPCHGEYEEPNGDKDTDGKTSKSGDNSQSDDDDSDSDNGMTHNVRKRVVAESTLLRNYRNQQRPIAYNDNDVTSVHDFLGLDADGTVSGVWDRTGDRGHSGFSDAELCSQHCFWKVLMNSYTVFESVQLTAMQKTNRTVETSEWSKEQLEVLNCLLSAYISSRRGPCMMTYAFDKPCQEVSEM